MFSRKPNLNWESYFRSCLIFNWITKMTVADRVWGIEDTHYIGKKL